ncbi:MAG: exonuclease SbcCD subunit D [Candidatus Dormibacteraeota bacterium]|nr:exonuclease SbcCD subunit D [Candidatus Dormibacteraeota bacterium]
MKIVHTSDWHLGAELRHVSRLEDQMERVEEILSICDERDADVLLIAGDFLNETRPRRMETVLRRFAALLKPRLERGLQVVVVAGNHDHDWVFQLLHTARELFGEAAGTRMRFVWKPELLVIENSRGERFRLVCLPYPRQPAYDLEAIQFKNAADRNHQLGDAVKQRILGYETTIREDPEQMPTVLMAHLLIQGMVAHDHELSEEADVPIPRSYLPNFAYTALGHVHLPTELGSAATRYCGSMERMDFGEIGQERQVVLVELDSTGRVRDPEAIALHPTEFIELEWHEGDDLVEMARAVPPEAICRLIINVPRGGNPQAVQAQAKQLIARLCWPPEVRWEGDTASDGEDRSSLALERADWQGSVRAYVAEQVADDDALRARLLEAVEELIAAEANS